MSKSARSDEGPKALTRLGALVERLRGLLLFRKQQNEAGHLLPKCDQAPLQTASLEATICGGGFSSTSSTQGVRRHNKRLRPSQKCRLQKLHKCLWPPRPLVAHNITRRF